MATGTIKTLIPGKGFGFITTGGGSDADLFFHNSAVVDGNFDSLEVGQKVSFEAGPDPRDPGRRRATNVQPVESAVAE